MSNEASTLTNVTRHTWGFCQMDFWVLHGPSTAKPNLGQRNSRLATLVAAASSAIFPCPMLPVCWIICVCFHTSMFRMIYCCTGIFTFSFKLMLQTYVMTCHNMSWNELGMPGIFFAAIRRFHHNHVLVSRQVQWQTHLKTQNREPW